MKKNIIRSVLIRHLNNISIKTKLLMFFFIVTIIPFVVISIVIYKNISTTFQEQTRFSTNQMFEQAASLLQYKIKNILNISDIIAFDDKTIQEVLKRPKVEFHDNYFIQNIDYNRLKDYIEKLQINEDLYKVILYINASPVIVNENVNFMSWDEQKSSGWYKQFETNTEKFAWLSPYTFDNGKNNIKVISAIRFIRDLDNIQNVIGLMRIDIKESDIESILRNSVSTPSSKVFLLNRNGEIISSSSGIEGNTQDIVRNLNIKWNSIDNSDAWYPVNSGSGMILIKSKLVENTDWKLIAAIPYSDIESTSIKSRNQMLVLIFITVLLAYILAYLFSYSLTKRISQLIKLMRKVETGDFNVEIIPHGNDEFGQLQKNFNYMLTKIALLLDEKYAMGKDIKNAELKALQSQINPHFLYNTLDMINSRSLRKNVPEISSIVQKLAKFYKLSLSNGDEIVPLAYEIEHIRAYVQIQNERFDNKISLTIDIDECLQQYGVLRIILQPIVENSILHGIMEKPDESGSIKVEGRLEDDFLFLTVTDDGVGIPQSRLETLLNRNKAGSNKSYGIKNIDTRIKLYYGENYGLAYTSRLGKGTKVEIRIPARLLKSY